MLSLYAVEVMPGGNTSFKVVYCRLKARRQYYAYSLYTVEVMPGGNATLTVCTLSKVCEEKILHLKLYALEYTPKGKTTLQFVYCQGYARRQKFI